MNYTISPDRKTLTIAATRHERALLRRQGDEIHTDSSMHDFLEPLTCNSELEWIPEGVTGDLTNAPMLGIMGLTPDNEGCNPIVSERWAFMDYQVRSVLEDLRDKGEAVFVDRF